MIRNKTDHKKYILKNHLIDRFGDLLTTIRKTSKSSDRSHLQKIIKQYCLGIESRRRSRGDPETVKFYKDLHLVAIYIATGRKHKPLSFVKSDKLGRPRLLRDLVPLLLSENKEDKRCALSITRLYQGITIDPSLDISSITEPCKVEALTDDWMKFLFFWTRKFKQPDLSWDGKWHATTKTGPNGPALVTAHLDLHSIVSDRPFRGILKEWICLTDPSLDVIMKAIWSNIKHEPRPGQIHSKLALLPEGGGKTRVIAIADYFTQESLKSLFRETMGYLKQLTTDGTYNQGQIVLKLKQAIRDGKPIYCYDLSSATDRFPVFLQRDLLSPIIGSRRALVWAELLTKRGFSFKGKDVEYKTGQPMGILTSWSVFALTHHAIIEYCAFKENISSFRDYVILGDDVAIFNKKVSKRYLKLLDHLGVPISLSKSFVWEPGSSFPPSGEIAKRLILREEEITPLPFELVKTFLKTPRSGVLELRLKLEQIGVETNLSVWETLSLLCPKRDRKWFLLLATAPLGLIGPTIGLSAPIQGVEQGPWLGIDFDRFHKVMCEVIINDLSKKVESIPSIIQNVFNKGYFSLTEDKSWRHTKYKKGSPISLSDLGFGPHSTDDSQHPLIGVMNTKLVELQKTINLIREIKKSPETNSIEWEDVYALDFNLNETFVPKRRKRLRMQAGMITKAWQIYHSDVNLGND